VTGGAGFIGSHLCRKLLERGHDVLCVDNLFTGSKGNIRDLLSHPSFEFMRHDITFPLFVEVVTINVPEVLSFSSSDFKFPLRLVHNSRPRGFSANHNAAFAGGNSPFFCVANPDVRLTSDPFPGMMKAFDGERIAVAGPLVRARNGQVEDSARRFPTPYSLVRKALRAVAGPRLSDRRRIDRGELDCRHVHALRQPRVSGCRGLR
jgi:hypothetical protein